jgi:uncharacterized protein
MGSVSYYLDANLLVVLVTPEAFSERAQSFVEQHPNSLIVSDFGAAEFSSVTARRVRTRHFSPAEGTLALSIFDDWIARSAVRVEMNAQDVAYATACMRRFDLPLRTPDAIHLAIARRLGATLVTFDGQMAASAEALGIAVATP